MYFTKLVYYNYDYITLTLEYFGFGFRSPSQTVTLWAADSQKKLAVATAAWLAGARTPRMNGVGHISILATNI